MSKNKCNFVRQHTFSNSIEVITAIFANVKLLHCNLKCMPYYYCISQHKFTINVIACEYHALTSLQY